MAIFFRYFNIRNFKILEYRSFYIWSFQILYNSLMFEIVKFWKIVNFSIRTFPTISQIVNFH